MKARLAEKRSSFSLDWICLSQETQKTCRGSSSFTPCAGENYKAGKLQLMRVFLGHSLLVLERRYALFIPRIWLKVAENKTGFVSWEEQIFLSKLPGPGPSLGRISAVRPVGSAPGTGLGPCPWDAFSSADGLIRVSVLTPVSHLFGASFFSIFHQCPTLLAAALSEQCSLCRVIYSSKKGLMYVQEKNEPRIKGQNRGSYCFSVIQTVPSVDMV